MAVDEKLYADKAVQVFPALDSMLVSQVSSSMHRSKNVSTDPSSVTSKNSSGASSTHNVMHTPPDVPYARLSSLSLYKRTTSDSTPEQKLESRHPYNDLQLPHNRLPLNRGGEKRLVSLPETMPMDTSSDSATGQVNGPLRRVVSLTSLLTRSRSDSPSTQCGGCSLEYSETSVDTSCHSSGSMHVKSCNCYPSSILMIPSPPSSPESIHISDNTSCITRSFLPKYNLSPSRTCNCEDNIEWITWASSPPRPIPALHGPPSLPYARCPSGAEGTIIEDGADLPRMIWGLDLCNTKTRSPLNAPAPKKQWTYLAASTQNHLPNTASRDDLSDSDASQSHRSRRKGTASSGDFCFENTAMDSVDYAVNRGKGQLWRDSYPPINIHAPDLRRAGYNLPLDNLGLGREVLTSCLDNHAHTNQKTTNLKAIAPLFIPKTPAKITHSQTRIFVEPRTGSKILAGHRLSALEIAQNYHNQKQRNTLSAPAFSSLTWSSTHPCYSSTSSSPPIIQDLKLSNAEPAYSNHCNITNSLDHGERDYSKELRKVKLAKLELETNKNIGGPSITQTGFAPIHLQGIQNCPLPPLSISKAPFTRTSSMLDASYVLKQPLFDMCFGSTIQEPTVLSHAVQQPHTQTPFNQQPQSMPLARLIQRRLSSVAEEESNPSPNPPIQPPSTHQDKLDSDNTSAPTEAFANNDYGNRLALGIAYTNNGRIQDTSTKYFNLRKSEEKENANNFGGPKKDERSARKKRRPRRKGNGSCLLPRVNNEGQAN